MTRQRFCPLALLVAIVLVASPGVSHAAWPSDPSINVPLCTAPNNQQYASIIPDGSGGATLTWEDSRSGTGNIDIYAQHVLASGAVDPAWPVDGRALCTAAGNQFTPTIASDGAGGAIVTWSDRRNGTHYDIYAQHVLASGAVDPAWPVDGRALCTAAGNQYGAIIVSDGAGGAIATWYDGRSGTFDIYAQRVGPGGQLGSDCGSRNEIISFAPGLGTSLTNAYQSVGASDGRGTPLGYQGQLVLRFLCDIADGPGADVRVYELGQSFPLSTNENYRVEASADNINYVVLGDSPGDITDFDLGAAGLASARYIRITDRPPDECSGIPNCDRTVMGADIDAVVALHTLVREVDCADAIDNDGDGLVDCADGDCHVDADGDGFWAPPCGSDCNDLNAAAHPGAVEICNNGIDDDCNGLVDCAQGSCAWPAYVETPDCESPCSSSLEFCQWFEYVGGAAANRKNNFDIVVGADKTMSESFLTSTTGLPADITAIRTKMAQFPLDPAVLAKISWWRCKQRVALVKQPTDDGEEIGALENLLVRYGFDAIAFRSSSGAETRRTALLPYCWYADDPGQDGAVTALHELGHAAFGLGDEYSQDECGGLPCSQRMSGIRNDGPTANVWGSLSDCEEKVAYYAQCGVSAPCFEFCDPGETWRLGSDTENANLMRAKCNQDQEWRWTPGNGYGQMGNIRAREVVTRLVTPCFVPSRVSGSISLATEAAAAARYCDLKLSYSATGFAATDVQIVPGEAAPVIPTTDPIYVDLIDATGATLSDVRPWDPRFFGMHQAIPSSGDLEVQIQHLPGATGWAVRQKDGSLLASGSLAPAFFDYCRRVNWTDADCWTSEGPVAVLPMSTPAKVRLLPAWPNPAQNRASLRLELPRAAPVSVRIFDLAGRRVRSLADGTLEPGIHTLEWDTNDRDGRRVTPGVYFCSATIGAERFQRTIVVVR